MKIIIKENNHVSNFEKIVMLLVSMVVIMNSTCIYRTGELLPYVAIISALILGVYSFYCLLPIFTNKKKLNKYETAYIVYYLVVTLMLPLLWRRLKVSYIYFAYILFPGTAIIIFSAYMNKKIKTFAKAFLGLMACIACVSLFFWFFGSTLKIIQPTNKFVLEWGGEERYIPSYFNLYFETQNSGFDFFGLKFEYRNSAIFPEGPMSCFVFISASVMNEITIKKKWLRILFLITVFSTLTTTGMIYIGLMIIYFVASKSISTTSKSLLLLVAFALFIFVFIYLMSQKSETGSGQTRLSDIITEFNAFLKRPLYGWGYVYYTDGSSNSITALLADGGIFWWLLFYGPLLFCGFSFKKNNISMPLLTWIFTIIFSMVAIQYTPLPIVVIYTLLFEQIKVKQGKKDLFRYYVAVYGCL